MNCRTLRFLCLLLLCFLSTVALPSRQKRNIKELFKRIIEQKPTISVGQLTRERRSNERYLKFIGRYPYQSLTKRYETEPELPPISERAVLYEDQDQELVTRVIRLPTQDVRFEVIDLDTGRSLSLVMSTLQFEMKKQKAGDLRQMISRLRVSEAGKVFYATSDDS